MNQLTNIKYFPMTNEDIEAEIERCCQDDVGTPVMVPTSVWIVALREILELRRIVAEQKLAKRIAPPWLSAVLPVKTQSVIAGEA